MQLPSPTIYMDAVLTPNRSLSTPAFNVVMILVAVVSLACGLMFLSLGAWPVIGYFGADALALWLAFRWVRRRGQEETRVTITAETVHLHHRDAKGRERTAQVPAAFARVELDEPVRPTSWLRIEHGRTAYIIGRFLTPKERKSLAEGLRGALVRARGERHPA